MEDGGEIIVSARQESIAAGHRSGLKVGSYVCLSVTDTGEGMDEETRARRSNLSSRRRGLAKGPASAFRWCTSSPSNPAGI
jgi:signal transduction histidine kinase